jgi:ribosomal protein S18 acetylase RimI-like enzyme
VASSTRPITAADLQQVIAIDTAHSGGSRRRFFEKRFAAAKARPSDFVQLGVMEGNTLRGFAIAHILRGEFGRKDAIAVLDALGVAPDSKEHGFGQILVEELIAISRQRGARSLHSQVDWKSADLLRFFNSAHFKLAPRVALERSTNELLEQGDEEP